MPLLLDDASLGILQQFDKLVVKYAKSWIGSKQEDRLSIKIELLEQATPLFERRWLLPVTLKNSMPNNKDDILELEHVIKIPNTKCSWLLPSPHIATTEHVKPTTKTEFLISGMVVPYKTISSVDKEYEEAKSLNNSLEVEVFFMKGSTAVRQLILLTLIEIEI